MSEVLVTLLYIVSYFAGMSAVRLCVRELNRMLAREDLLWVKARKVSQQALSQRLLSFPAELFEKVLADLLVILNQRWHQRNQRTLPLSVDYARQHFEQLWIVDASTLEALFQKLKSLETW